jgi:hypothetical protein
LNPGFCDEMLANSCLSSDMGLNVTNKPGTTEGNYFLGF